MNRLHLLLALAASLLLTILLQAEKTAGEPITGSALPTLSPPPGHYDEPIRLTISPPAPGMEIFYTLDGRIPTPEQALAYQRPIPIGAAAKSSWIATPFPSPPTPYVVTIRAIARHPGEEPGLPITASYFFGPLPDIPIMSLVVEPSNLWGLERGIYTNKEESGIDWERPVHITYLDKPGHVQAEIAGGIRIHGHGSRYSDKKSWRLYFRREYGVNRWQVPIFPDGRDNNFKRLILHASGQDIIEKASNWTLLRNSLAYELGQTIGGIALRTRPVVLTINGELWGIYHLSERFDEYLFADQMDIDDYEWLDTPEVKARLHLYPEARRHWDHLMDFVETHDLTQPEHYDYIATQIDLENFIDYVALEIYFGNSDWPRNNVLQFRPRVQGGRWQWVLWDFEYGFGHARHSPVDLNMVTVALDGNSSRITGRFSQFLTKLLQNDDFQEAFLTRTADLLNTALAPPVVTQQIDTLADSLRPAIGYESARWQPLAEDDWEGHIEEMRLFAQERPFFVRQHLADRLGRPTETLTINLPAPSQGAVLVNGMPLDGSLAGTWEGIYFQDNRVQLTAVPASGYAFSSWGDALPDENPLTVTMDTPVTLTPSFSPP